MPASQKKILRVVMKEKRRLLFQEHPNAGVKITAHFFNSFNLTEGTIVGGYWPMRSELDIRPLLSKLFEQNFRCALPHITSDGLIFREWTPLTHLEEGLFQALEPPSTAPVLIPHVLLVPLLAFDHEGHRLGYGQGHFDRFLHQHKVLTIGVGFKGQEVEQIPRQAHDFALDYLLTEEGVVARDTSVSPVRQY
ncbi:MAG TPA: 5-formyltetrahydrofolate cyclo-ligase [Alphaproteobacteria bacterium]|nr:5-formyltetrahydrofolate cyclo-ligase [Alphaproteobacteria bacterium]